MNKKGFTVAEVLASIAVVGLLAALTLPQMATSHQKKVFGNSLAAAVSDLENAMSLLKANDGVDRMQSTAAWKGDFLENIKVVLPYREDDVSFSSRAALKKGGSAVSVSSDYAILNKKNILYAFTIPEADKKIKETDVMLKGGALVSQAAEVWIDVNGEDKPNVVGRDTFYFYLGEDGKLYPYGGKDWSIYEELISSETEESGESQEDPNDVAKEQCTTWADGKYCGAYLQNNGYVMNY